MDTEIEGRFGIFEPIRWPIRYSQADSLADSVFSSRFGGCFGILGLIRYSYVPHKILLNYLLFSNQNILTACLRLLVSLKELSIGNFQAVGT